MRYPSHFNDRQKKEFDDAIDIMKQIGGNCLIANDDENFVYIELPSEPSELAFQLFRTFNETHSLFLELVESGEHIEGVRYYGG